jgi:ribonuclease J
MSAAGKPVSDRDPLRIVPLGGLGEFGLNCLVVERGEDAIAIDCGVMFPEDHMMGIDRVLPDLSYLRGLGDRLKGIVLTHGHEDHIGALPYVIPDLDVPIFATPFTSALLERKLEEYPAASNAQIEKYDPGDTWTLGALGIEGLRVTHSIVDACAVAVRAGGDLVIHTGDFKLDTDPIDGLTTDLDRFRALGDDGVSLLLSDSTNVEVPGVTQPESAVPMFLRPIFRATRGRLFVTTFASHVHRIQNLVAVCREFGRAVAFVGRSMEGNASLATRTGHLRIPGDMLVSAREAEKMAPDKVCFIVTGSQGEPGSALSRIALLQMANLQPRPGDAVIFSSRAIPGNDKAIAAVVNQLFRCGAEVYDSRVAEVHVSGHACREELRQMIDLVRPRAFVPLHGEYRNLVHHARLAIETGVARENCFTLVDGEVLEIRDGTAARADTVDVGRVLVDGGGVGDVDAAVVRDRRHIAEDGVVTVIVAVKRQTGEIVEGPNFITRGLVSPDEEAEAFEEARRVVRAKIESMTPAAIADLAELQEEVRLTTRRFFRRRFGRRPVVVPYVMEL